MVDRFSFIATAAMTVEQAWTALNRSVSFYTVSYHSSSQGFPDEAPF